MLEQIDLQKIAKAVFVAQLPNMELEALDTEPYINSDGDDRLKIRLLFATEGAAEIPADASLKLLVAMNDALRARGEDRFAVLEFASVDDAPDDED